MQSGDLLRNRYRIEKALATGGFGETYLAIDQDFPGQPRVVVKHLKPVAQDPHTLQIANRLFEAEAQALAEMGKDTHIPTLYAYFEEQGQFYLVQEFIAGQTLTAELTGTRLDELKMLRVLQDILLGLKVVHGTNKVHRDLKPENIIRRATDQRLVLIDFGAVKEIRQASLTTPNPTASISIGIGTEGYMPMEQAMGRPRPASDIYAVGAIGIQCLTGHSPGALFDENTCTLRWQHLCRVSPDVARVLDKMVARTPADRYSDAMEAVRAIEDLLAARPVQASIPVPLPRPVTTNPVVPPVLVSPHPTKIVRPATPPKPASRRSVLQWLGFGGFGLLMAGLLSQWNNSTLTDSPGDQTSKLTKIQFTSVKLDNSGQIIDQPQGSAEVFTEDLGGGVLLTMVKIPAGKFMMGSPDAEQERDSDEGPQRLVTIPEFYLSQTLVTQAQWQAIMGHNPSSFQGNDQLPVDTVNWLDAMTFCHKLSARVNRSYRLPSEAEWEYACRAGTTTPFTFGEAVTTAVVNYHGDYPHEGVAKGKYRGKTTLVKSFPPNEFGLYDVHGNVWEWCLDEYFDSYGDAPSNGSARGDFKSRNDAIQRLLRGGAWYNGADDGRTASRHFETASVRNDGIGVRVASISLSPENHSYF